MESEIAIYATSYVFARLAVVAAFAYAFYRVLRPAPIAIRHDRQDHGPNSRARIIFDDHC